MAKKYHVSRIKSVLQSTTVLADSESQAIELARKQSRKLWADVDDKRRKNYVAKAVTYSA